MLRFGIISQINPELVQAKVRFEDDESTSYWLPILQTKTLKDKYYSMPNEGEQVVCLMDENCEDGVILGAIYSSADAPVVKNEKEISLNLEDNSLININKETQTLTISFKNIRLIGNIDHDGILKNTKGISSDAEVSDKTSTMQTIRDTYNGHSHPDKNTQTTSKM